MRPRQSYGTPRWTSQFVGYPVRVSPASRPGYEPRGLATTGGGGGNTIGPTLDRNETIGMPVWVIPPRPGGTRCLTGVVV